ncbi:hypothetical protein MSPP1_003736 [Malassezia sp. CBS 17886]|nr:hypothetical protein MSPP1_003736 [Malassezia sp. CBS 17886]
MTTSNGVFTATDGARIAWECHGTEHTGTPLVLVNGLSAVMSDWGALTKSLAASRKVLVFDHRGIGKSHMTESETEDVSIELLARDLLDLLNHLDFHAVDLLGFSMGGAVVLAIVTRDDAQPAVDGAGVAVQGVEVRHVVLTATFTKMPRGDFKMGDVPSANGLSRDAHKRALTEFLVQMQYHPDVLVPGNPLHAQMQMRVQDSLATRRPQATIMHHAGAITLYDVRERLAQVPRALPVRIVHGRRDRMVDYNESKKTEELLPQARRLLPCGAADSEEFGHMWFDYFDLDAAWVRPLSDFLDDAPDAHL